MSQDINADPEVWELTDKFGDRALRIWFEILSIGDRNAGQLPGKWETYPRLLAGRCRSSRRHVEKVCEWVARWLVIDSEGVASIRNWTKYQPSWVGKTSPSEPSVPSEPSEPSKIKNQEPATPEPSAEPANAGKKELDPRIRVWADKVYLTDKKKFAKLIVWIKECEKYNYEPVVIAAALERFLPYAASPEVQNWYVYLDKILLKTDKDINRDRHEAEHNRKKEETREASKITNLRNWVKDA